MLNSIYSNATAPDQFTVARLGQNVMPAVAALFEATKQSLPDDQSHFIKPQPLSDLRRHVGLGFPVIGAIDNQSGQLAAVLLMTPAEKAEFGKNLDGYPKHLMASGAAVVQCVAVHPDFKGNGLMDKILKGAEQLASTQHIYELVAKVADDNQASAKGFLKASFTPAAHGVDAKLGYDVTYWKKDCESLAPAALPLFNSAQHANDEFASFNCR